MGQPESKQRRGSEQVKATLRKATGHDFKDDFTSFVDAATTVMTGVHAEMKALDRRVQTDMAEMRDIQAAALAEVRQETEASLAQMRAELGEAERERLAHRDVHDKRLAFVRNRMRETRDATGGAVNAAGHMEHRVEQLLAAHQVTGRWMIGISSSALALAIAALVVALI